MKFLLLTALMFWVIPAQAMVSLARHVDLARSTYASVVKGLPTATKELREIFSVRLFAIKAQLLGLDDLKGAKLDEFIGVLHKEDSSLGKIYSKNRSFFTQNEILNSETLIDSATEVMIAQSRFAQYLPGSRILSMPQPLAGKIVKGVDMEGIAYAASGLSDVFPEFLKNKKVIGKLFDEGWMEAVVSQLDRYPREVAASKFDGALLRGLYDHPYMRGK